MDLLMGFWTALVAAFLGTAASTETPEAGLHGSSTSLGDGLRLFAPVDLAQAGRVTLSPGFAPDGQTIYFTQADCDRVWNCPQLLMRSHKTATGWSAPELVDLPQGARSDWPSVSPDGKTLLFSWAPRRARHQGEGVDVDFDLFRLDLTRTGAKPEPIDNPDINRIRGGRVATLRFVNNETAPVLTLSGDLYFWTERLDGVGLRDVYLARADGKGGFETPRPLPAPINYAGVDDASWVRQDGRLMIISSTREGSSDLFVSVKRADEWSTPVALGAPVNSEFADFAGRVSPDGKTLVFTSDRPARGDDAGLLQVWQIPVASVPALRAALSEVEITG